MNIPNPNEIIFEDPSWEDPQGNVLPIVLVTSELDPSRDLKTVHYLGYVYVVEFNGLDQEQADALNGTAV